jgi:hypothetical protein
MRLPWELVAVALLGLAAGLLDEDVRDLLLRRHGVELEARHALKTLVHAQARFQEEDLDRDGARDFAVSLGELASVGAIDPELASGRLRGYTVDLCASPLYPERCWMAIARPDDPHPRRRAYWSTDQSGYTRVSELPIPLERLLCTSPLHARVPR